MNTVSANRREFLHYFGSGLGARLLPPSAAAGRKPNFIIVLTDNLGYGDLGCYGSTKHRTPNLDRMARQGVRFTSFYAASGVCTPSRASLMSGCYPRRVGLDQTDPDGLVLRPVSPNGLNPDEVTIAEVLRSAGYATAAIGKWHLGDQPAFLPTRQGFDSYFGIPYSEDMVGGVNRSGGTIAWPPLPLMENEKVVEAPVDPNLLTKRYTEKAIDYITRHRDKPFFLYMPQATPGSSPQSFASERFAGKSANGLYGDAIEELDWSMGQLLSTLARLGLDENTMVVWTSDNGAVRRNPVQGSNLPLGGWGYSTAEGGQRVPGIARWPGRIPAGAVCDAVSTTMDLLPTFAGLAGTQPPRGRAIDGKDIWPLLSGKSSKSPHEAFFYYFGPQLQAVRSGRWKLFVPLRRRWSIQGTDNGGSPLALYDLQSDIAETTNVAPEHPEVVRRLTALAEAAREDLGDVGKPGKGQRAVGRVANPRPRIL